MATRGRKPTPTGIKKLRGNPGKRALNKREPTPKPKIPSCPPHLNATAKQEWGRLTKELHALGILAEVDRAALAACCSAYADYVEASEAIKREGAVTSGAQGQPIRSPWMIIKKQAMDQMVRFYAEFGMTPSSRARVKSDAKDPEEELEKMLFQADVKVGKN